MAHTLHTIMNGYPGVGGYGGGPFAVNSPRRVVEQGVNLPNAIGADLKRLACSGIKEFELLGLNGVLTITDNAQLIPNSDVSSDGFCIVNFKDASGQFKTFEIDFNRGAITVARKPKKDLKTQKTSVTSFLGHDEMMPLLEELVREAKVYTPKLPEGTQVSDELNAMRSQLLAVLKNPTFLRSGM